MTDSRRGHPSRDLVFCCLGLLLVVWTASPAGATKVLVDAGDDAARAGVLNAGGVRIADRGGYEVYEVPEGRRTAVAALPGVTVRPDFDRIRLRRREIDTRAAAAASNSAGRRLQLIQLAAPPTDEDVAAIEATGSRIVHYLPQNTYLVWAPEGPATTSLRGLVQRGGMLQYVGDFEPSDALAPDLDGARDDAAVAVTVQLFDHGPGTKTDVAAIEGRATEILEPVRAVLGGRYLNLRIEVPGRELAKIATLDSVVNVEPYRKPILFGERQGQLQAGNTSGAGADPSGPGYLAWLATKGFSTDPADYAVVVVVDDGVDDGTTSPATAEFYEFGNPANPSRLTFSVVPPGSSASGPEGPDGHGHINASITAGYSDLSGAAHEDAAGFNYGLGISPHGRMANVRVFAPSFDAGSGDATMVDDYYTRGARISTNSWGAPVNGAYTADAQLYDALTRDALAGTPGNQEILFLFSAGNSGPGSNTIGSPGTSKNVLTVGASETSNPDALNGDGCGSIGSEGDDARDMAGFSSRGPCDDGRMKPEIVSSGTFIMGNASQPTFNGGGVCGAATNDFSPPGSDALFPAGSLWTWSSGTSHSCPGVAGYTSLITEFLARQYAVAAPSAALLKAYVIHSGRHLTGSGANEDLPGNNQGFGFSDMGIGFDTTAPRLMEDQTTIFGSSGESFELQGQIPDATRPVRIALVWTDAPGSTVGDAFVNDLDLLVEIGSSTFRGNNFTFGESKTVGGADTINNSEGVFLSAGPSGQATIRVEATTIAGDGVPGNADSTDQDFALVAYNFVLASSAGAIFLDETAHSCADTVEVTIADSDLTGDGAAGAVLTTMSGDTETLSLTENPANSGLFEATIGTTTGSVTTEDGTLQVAHGGSITATYADADDGTGSPAAVQASAAVDCVAPSVSAVTTFLLKTTEAGVSFSTNESATGTVRYGTSCGALTGASSGVETTNHQIVLTGLVDLTTYYYVVDATDPAGNVSTDDNGGLCYSFTTLEKADPFVEQFENDADLDGIQLSFTPNGSGDYYELCQESVSTFSVAPGGTALSLPDDGSAAVVLTGGKQVDLYGTTYGSVYVNANGNVSFTSPDSSFHETLSKHFAQPRVAAHFDDFDPTSGGKVYAQQLTDRLVITWLDVPEYGTSNSNNVQIELFFDGRIHITQLTMASSDGIVGLSPGDGTPTPFFESDLSAAAGCVQLSLCPATPAVGCKTAGRSKLILRDNPVDARDLLIWKWTKGAETLPSELGDPNLVTTYFGCAYDRVGGVPTAPVELQVPPSYKWQVQPNRFRYRDSDGFADGVQTLLIIPKEEGKAKVMVRAKGANTPLPGPVSASAFFAADPAVTFQLHHDAGGTCWSADFAGATAQVNRPDQFKAKSP